MELLAAIVERKPHNAYLETPATRSLMPPLDGLHVLDAGCGPGHNAAWMLEQGAGSVVAVDVTSDFIAIAQERLTPYGERATVRRADLNEPLTFATDAEFDLIVSQLVLHYLKDWGGVLAEFHRVLKPGGWLVLAVGHPFADWLWAQRIIGEHSYFEMRQFDAAWGGFGEPKPVVRSYRRPLQDTLNPLLRAGFRLDEVLEPQPTADFQQADPDDYAATAGKPTFLCLRAQKPPTTA